jgi:hypothetical protein
MAVPRCSRPRLTAALAVAAVVTLEVTVVAVALAVAGPAQPVSPARRIEVRLNDVLLGHGLVVSARHGVLEWVRVADMQRAVDGSAAPNGRLRLAGV